MAYYLVTATPREGLLAELSDRLERDEFVTLRPFGRALTTSLRRARRLPSGKAMWEEEDYCRPPLAQEREAVSARPNGRRVANSSRSSRSESSASRSSRGVAVTR